MRISDWSSDVCSSDLVETRTVETPAHRQARHHGVVTPLARSERHAGTLRADRLDALLRHQSADGAQQQDIENVDDGIDLPQLLEQVEQDSADACTENASGHHYRPHLVVDTAAPGMREHARN